MKSMKKHFNFLSVLLIFFALMFSSCDVIWNANLKDELDPDISAKITFYSNTEADALSNGEELYSTWKYYRIGEVISSDKLPSSDNDSTVASWRPQAKVVGWNYYRKTENHQDLQTNGRFVSYTPTGEGIDVTAIYHYGYYVVYKYGDISSPQNYVTDDSKTELRFGPAGSITNVTPPVVAGFETPSVVDVIISDTVRNTVEVKYKRKTINVTFDANGGTLSTPSISGLYGDTFAVNDPTFAGYDFAGWRLDDSCKDVPYTPNVYPQSDVTLVAMWKGKKYSLRYQDCNENNLIGRDFTGIMSSLPSVHVYGEKTIIPIPVTAISPSENSVQFEGWYTDSVCSASGLLTQDAEGYYIDANLNSDIVLYAKWKPKYVYLDVNQAGTADDRNSGMYSSDPVKTVEAAKKILSRAQNNAVLKALYPIADEELKNLSGLTTSVCNNAVLERSFTTGPLLSYSLSVPVTLENITIDGKYSSGVSHDAAALNITGSGAVTLGTDFKITNYNETNGHGVVIVAYGSKAVMNGAEISYCKAVNPVVYVLGDFNLISGSINNNNCSSALDSVLGYVTAGGTTVSVSGSLNVTGGDVINNSGNGIKNSGVLEISGGTISGNTGESILFMNVDNSNASLFIKDAPDLGSGRIYITKNSTASTYPQIQIDGTVSTQIKVYAEHYESTPVILIGPGTNVETNYTKFISCHEGYSFNKIGKLVTSSSGGIIVSKPTVTEIDLGSLVDENLVIKRTGGAVSVVFNVTDAAYEAINSWGTSKYIQYTIDSEYGQTVIDPDTHQAVISLTSLEQGNGTTNAHVLNLGFNTLTVYAESSAPASKSLTPKTYAIMVTE